MESPTSGSAAEADDSDRAAFTIKEWCKGDAGRPPVHPMAVAICYQEINGGRLKSYKRGRRRYIPASERRDYPARLLAAQS